MQLATLMQLQGNRADPAQLERLQFMLSEKNNEIESLMMKVRELEKEKVSIAYYNQHRNEKYFSLRNYYYKLCHEQMTVKDQHPPAPSKEGELMDETYYTDLLKMQLANSK